MFSLVLESLVLPHDDGTYNGDLVQNQKYFSCPPPPKYENGLVLFVRESNRIAHIYIIIYVFLIPLNPPESNEFSFASWWMLKTHFFKGMFANMQCTDSLWICCQVFLPWQRWGFVWGINYSLNVDRSIVGWHCHKLFCSTILGPRKKNPKIQFCKFVIYKVIPITVGIEDQFTADVMDSWSWVCHALI